MGVAAGDAETERRSLAEALDREWTRILPPVVVIRQDTQALELPLTLPEGGEDRPDRWVLTEENGEAHRSARRRTIPTRRVLIATYGLRACDIRTLRLEELHWRQGEIRVVQRKTAQPLVLPLTDAAAGPFSSTLLTGAGTAGAIGAYRCQ
jgi:integrase